MAIHVQLGLVDYHMYMCVNALLVPKRVCVLVSDLSSFQHFTLTWSTSSTIHCVAFKGTAVCHTFCCRVESVCTVVMIDTPSDDPLPKFSNFLYRKW